MKVTVVDDLGEPLMVSGYLSADGERVDGDPCGVDVPDCTLYFRFIPGNPERYDDEGHLKSNATLEMSLVVTAPDSRVVEVPVGIGTDGCHMLEPRTYQLTLSADAVDVELLEERPHC